MNLSPITLFPWYCYAYFIVILNTLPRYSKLSIEPIYPEVQLELSNIVENGGHGKSPKNTSQHGVNPNP